MNKEKTITLSSLEKTWLFDLDGTILKHNGYKTEGKDSFLKGAKEFLLKIPKSDKIIFLTSRKKEQAKETEKFLKEAGVRYETIIYELPYGERLLFNDRKPSGLKTAYAIESERDKFAEVDFQINEEL